MRFEETRNNFSYIDNNKDLVTNTGELSKEHIKHIPNKLLTIDERRLHKIIAACQYEASKIDIFVNSVDDDLTQVAVELKDYDVSLENIQKSIKLSQSCSKDTYYRFGLHKDSQVVPFAPVEGILSIVSPSFTGLISVNNYESCTNNFVFGSNNTQLSFVVEDSVNIEKLVKLFKYPDCDILYDSRDTTELKEQSDLTKDPELCPPKYKNIVVEETEDFESVLTFNRRSKLYANGISVETSVPDDKLFNISGFIHNSCNNIHDPGSEFHNKIVVSEEQFDLIPEEMKKFAIGESQIPDDSIIKPDVGSTDKDGKEISKYISNKLEEKCTRKLQDKIPKSIDISDSLDSFSLEFVSLLLNLVDKSEESDYPDKFKDVIGYKTCTDFSEYKRLQMRCRIAPIEDPYKTKKYQLDSTYIGYVLRKSFDIDGNVYMGVNLQSQKTKVLKQDSKTHILVRVDNTEYYEKYKNSFGWKTQKSITKDTLDTFDISEELEDKFKSTSSSKSKSRPESIPKREITVHTKSGSTRNQVNYTIKSYTNKLNSSSDINLILFPRGSEYNLSDNKNLCTKNIHISAPKTNKEVEYLSKFDNVYKYEEYAEAIENLKFTSAGKSSITEKEFSEMLSFTGIGYTPAFHIISELEYKLLQDTPTVITKSKELLKQNVIEEDFQYIPIQKSKYEFIKPLLSEKEKYTIKSPSVSLDSFSMHNSNSFRYSLSRAYAKSKLDQEEYIKYFEQNSNEEVTEEFVKIVDTLAAKD